MSDVVQKLWGFCHTLRHDGIDYGDYIEQITYLLFLKMSDERGIDLTKVKMRAVDDPKKTTVLNCSWPALTSKAGTDLTDYYANVLRALGQQEGLLGDIFSGAQSRFNKPTNLKKLLTTIDETEWTTLEVNVKADAFEGLLEKAASEGKKGAGQYFTPRLLIQSIVRCMKPDPRSSKDYKICDPACGTGEFLVSSYEWLLSVTKNGAELDRATAKRVKTGTYYGQDLVPRPRRLALMNLYLHNLEPHISLGDSIYDPPPGDRFDCILTNPPFGTRGANQAPTRDDFTISTSNKQLNFLQHVLTTLKPGGRAAVVVPDNCMFADQAGEVFRLIAEDCNLHTVLRLPDGTFTPYSPGTKTNVVFFTKGYPTETVWIYDGRTNVPQITKIDRPLTTDYFTEFEKCFGKDPNGDAKRKESDSGEDRWRRFSIAEVKARDFKFASLKWLKDESGGEADELSPPEDIATEAANELELGIGELNAIVRVLGSNSAAPFEITDDEVPEGWTLTTVGKAYELNPRKVPPDSLPADAPVTFVPMAAVDAASGAITNPEIREFGEVRKGYTSFAEGDVIVAKITPCMENGKAAIARNLTNGLAFGSTEFHVLRPIGAAIPEYIYFFIRQEHFRREAESHMTGSVGQKRVPPSFLGESVLPLPPFAEQQRIVGKVEALMMQVNKARERVKSAAAILGLEVSATGNSRLVHTILAKAFRGELVEREADLARREGRDYEPASVVLERIAAERVTADNGKPKTRRKRSMKTK